MRKKLEAKPHHRGGSQVEAQVWFSFWRLRQRFAQAFAASGTLLCPKCDRNRKKCVRHPTCSTRTYKRRGPPGPSPFVGFFAVPRQLRPLRWRSGVVRRAGAAVGRLGDDRLGAKARVGSSQRARSGSSPGPAGGRARTCCSGDCSARDAARWPCYCACDGARSRDAASDCACDGDSGDRARGRRARPGD